MENANKPSITVQTSIPVPITEVWNYWTKPVHITNWNFASEEWHCPKADNELMEGGKFSWRMESKDGAMGFDYSGIYKLIDLEKKIVKKLDDDRLVTIEFSETTEGVLVTETFEIEDQNSPELQQNGWQAILNNFKSYCIQRYTNN